ncbi:3-keto-disaccharide hydrolase [Larkinella terrae]|uniref:DUF1080 domain-containing protein n=1 Tax=Larkinella terrae TaxID=2025311 RepID=A0A7K0EEX4_9BACT|nr:DUF1080 domain-containing protein [Larkinella terrae]MRS60374.1 DUF1080 domain-containing protein [Larkinella terrae]
MKPFPFQKVVLAPLLLAIPVLLVLSGSTKSDHPENRSKNQQKGWEVLFDGHDLTKWQNSTSDSIPYKGWKIENGTLAVTSGRVGGDIITRESFRNFELELDFNLTESANSGIKYLVNRIKNAKTNATSLMGIEYQIIDDFNYPEVKPEPNSTISTGAVYLLYPPRNKKLLPPGQWNKVRIVVNGKHIEHWLNGKLLASYDRMSPDFQEKVAQSKFRDYPDYAKADSGRILLQDHGNHVYFRNIRIKRLD